MSIKDCTLKIEYDMTEVYKGLDKLSDKTKKAAEGALKDVTVLIANDVIKGSRVDTGHNRRSIAYRIGSKETRPGSRTLYKGKGAEKPFNFDYENLKTGQSAIYSTSGYGGYLETGYTARNGRRIGGVPYFKPALDRHIGKFTKIMKEKLKW